MRRIYWCEFPEKCNWKKITDWLKHEKIIIYIACSSRANYESWKKKINKYPKNIEVNAWPILPKNEGYWFSAFSKKEAIDRLEEYRGLKIKLDLEPPIPKTYSMLGANAWLCKYMAETPENLSYFKRKIKSLSKDTDIILSTFPLPRRILLKWGWIKSEKLHYNFMYYPTFMPAILKKLYKHYYKRHFLPYQRDAYVAVGLINTGIFNKEPIYKTPEEMKKDIQFLRKQGVETIIFYSIEGISKRGEDWLYASLEI